MTRSIRNGIKKMFRTVFLAGQKAGVTVLPYHFYSQIPNIAELSKDDYWKKPMSMTGVDGMEEAAQISFLNELRTELFPRATQAMYARAVAVNGEGGGYGLIEAEVLYAFVRKYQPPRIIQVGCGVSTAIILQAATDASYKPEIICVEPFPTPYLKKLSEAGAIRLISEKAQKVALEELTSLEADDFFFVDSTHTVKTGSEVNRIMLEVLPRLKSGVWIHFHDIYFPFDYGRGLLSDDLFFWSESTLLHALLVHNQRLSIQLSLSFLHHAAPAALRRCFPDYQPQGNDFGLRTGLEGHFPSSIFLKSGFK